MCACKPKGKMNFPICYAATMFTVLTSFSSLSVNDSAKAKAFYSDVLELSLKKRTDGLAL